MKPIDIFLILIILTIVALVIYFGLLKNKGNPCSSCPYSGQSNCHCKTKENSDVSKSKVSKNNNNSTQSESETGEK